MSPTTPGSGNPGNPGGGPPPVAMTNPANAGSGATPAPRGGVPPGRSSIPMTGGGPGQMALGVAVSVDGQTGAVTARQAGSLIDMRLDVSPSRIPLRAALQNLAKSVNVAFQSTFSENALESVYQAAIVRKREIVIVHRDYFGYGTGWFSMFGLLLKSMQLTLQGPDPASPEGQAKIKEKGPSSIRGLLSIVGRKLDIVPEYEDRVPFYVEQMFDRLEASGIIVGWDRSEWIISTTVIGLNIRITPNFESLGIDPDAPDTQKPRPAPTPAPGT